MVLNYNIETVPHSLVVVTVATKPEPLSYGIIWLLTMSGHGRTSRVIQRLGDMSSGWCTARNGELTRCMFWNRLKSNCCYENRCYYRYVWLDGTSTSARWRMTTAYFLPLRSLLRISKSHLHTFTEAHLFSVHCYYLKLILNRIFLTPWAGSNMKVLTMLC